MLLPILSPLGGYQQDPCTKIYSGSSSPTRDGGNTFPLVGIAAFEASCKALGIQAGDEFLLAYGECNQLTLRAQKLEHGVVAWPVYKRYGYQRGDATTTYQYEDLRKLAKGQNLLLFASLTTKGRSKQDIERPAQYLYAEIDDLSLPEQQDKWDAFYQASGLQALLRIYSGSKSEHNYIGFHCDKIETWQFYQRYLCALMNADPAPTSPHQPMRMAGFPRIKNGEEREVTVLACNPDAYYSELELKTALDMAWPYPQPFTDARWKKYRSAVAIANNPTIDNRQMAPMREPADAFRLADDELFPTRQPTKSKQSRTTTTYATRQKTNDSQLNALMAPLLNLPLEKQYSLAGYNHEFRDEPPYLAGRSPWSPTNSSGTSFKVFANGGWFCHTSQQGGNLAQYLQLQWFGKRDDELSQEEQREFNTRIQAIAVRYSTAQPADLDVQKRELSRLIQTTFNRAAYRYWKRFGQLPDKPQPNPASRVETATYTYAKDGAIALYDPFFHRRWVVEVTPDTVPTVEEWKQLGSPRLIYHKRDRMAIVQRLIALGYPLISLEDVVGEGKSHFAAEFLREWQEQELVKPEGDAIQRAYYLSNDYRNPTTQGLEAIPEAVTAGALVYDKSKTTPSGEYYRRRPSGKQEPDIPALCDEDKNIQLLRSKGINVYRGTKSGYCKNACIHQAQCPYLTELQGQRDSIVLRSHPSKVHPAETDIGLIDEAGQAITTSQAVQTNLHEIGVEIGKLAQFEPQLYQQYQPLIEQLHQGITRAVLERDPKHGLVRAAVMKYLPSRDELAELLWDCTADEWLNSTQPWQHSQSLDELSRQLRLAVQPDIGEAFSTTTQPHAKSSIIGSWFTSGILAVLINIIDGKRIDIRIAGSGSITISRRNRQLIQNIQQFQTAILLDATPDIEHLARQLGRPFSDICQIQAYKPQFSNLTIKNIHGFGQGRMQRRPSKKNEDKYADSAHTLENRSLKLVEAICQQNPTGTTGILDYKQWIKQYKPLTEQYSLVMGYHYVDNRGSNQFKNCDQMISVPNPVENLGALLTEWYLLTGESSTTKTASPAFWAWANRRSTNELIQDIGRNRSQHRLDQSITHWLCSDLKPSQIEAITRYYQGCTFETVNVFEICPEAAPKGKQTEYRIFQAMFEQIQRFGIAKIQQVAAQVGIVKSEISRKVNKLSLGFKALNRSLVLLYKALNRETELSELDISPTDLFLAQQYLPEVARLLNDQECTAEEALKEFVNLAESCGAKTFRNVIALASDNTILSLFGVALTGLLDQVATVLPDGIPTSRSLFPTPCFT